MESSGLERRQGVIRRKRATRALILDGVYRSRELVANAKAIAMLQQMKCITLKCIAPRECDIILAYCGAGWFEDFAVVLHDGKRINVVTNRV